MMEYIEGEIIEDDIPEDILEEANSALNSLIPQKSAIKYEKQFAEFNKWCDAKKVKPIKEEVFLAYMSELSKKLKPPTLWSKFSMLKSMCKIKLNLHISNYHKLNAFLKRQSV